MQKKRMFPDTPRMNITAGRQNYVRKQASSPLTSKHSRYTHWWPHATRACLEQPLHARGNASPPPRPRWHRWLQQNGHGVTVLPRGLGPAVNPFAEGPGKRGQGRRPRHSRWAPRAVVEPWCPQLLAPGHVSGLTAGCSGEEEHSPGSTGLCRGRSGQEGTEDLGVDVLLGQRGSSRTSRSQAAALSCSPSSSRGCQGGFFHAPLAAPAWLCSATLLPLERQSS